jgi:ferrochelatase
MTHLVAQQTPAPYDAILFLSFGGPEGSDDVIPFLENVLRGRNVPRERMLQVAEQYQLFGGKSPINDQVRALITALEKQLAADGPNLPIYWGNRNWHPLLADTLRQMASDGIQRALVFVTSAYSSYSGCRQYREDIARAQAAVGENAPALEKLRVFFNHPSFIEPMIENTRNALAQLTPESPALIFTAHSIPLSMAQTSRYQEQLEEACRLVAEGVGRADWRLVYQSRSGQPNQPWLEPDINDYLRELHASNPAAMAAIIPIGFISDHMEVKFDLDTEAMQTCAEIGLKAVRVPTVGAHSKFISMIRELILERVDFSTPRRALGSLGPWHDTCPIDCCPAPTHAPQRPATHS